MNIYDPNMFDLRNLNLRLFTNALKLDKQVKDSYNMIFYLHYFGYVGGMGCKVYHVTL